jgi:hypothetical protein
VIVPTKWTGRREIDGPSTRAGESRQHEYNRWLIERKEDVRSRLLLSMLEKNKAETSEAAKQAVVKSNGASDAAEDAKGITKVCLEQFSAVQSSGAPGQPVLCPILKRLVGFKGSKDAEASSASFESSSVPYHPQEGVPFCRRRV